MYILAVPSTAIKGSALARKVVYITATTYPVHDHLSKDSMFYPAQLIHYHPYTQEGVKKCFGFFIPKRQQLSIHPLPEFFHNTKYLLPPAIKPCQLYHPLRLLLRQLLLGRISSQVSIRSMDYRSHLIQGNISYLHQVRHCLLRNSLSYNAYKIIITLYMRKITFPFHTH